MSSIKRTERLQVRMTMEEKLEFQAKAEAAGLSLSDFAREAMDGKRVGRKLDPEKQQLADALTKVWSELNAQGRNINQMAKMARLQKTDATEETLRTYFVTEVNPLLTQLETLLNATMEDLLFDN